MILKTQFVPLSDANTLEYEVTTSDEGDLEISINGLFVLYINSHGIVNLPVLDEVTLDRENPLPKGFPLKELPNGDKRLLISGTFGKYASKELQEMDPHDGIIDVE